MSDDDRDLLDGPTSTVRRSIPRLGDTWTAATAAAGSVETTIATIAAGRDVDTGDPTSLPLFSSLVGGLADPVADASSEFQAPRPGRVRGSFSLTSPAAGTTPSSWARQTPDAGHGHGPNPRPGVGVGIPDDVADVANLANLAAVAAPPIPPWHVEPTGPEEHEEVDWELVASLRQQASDRLSAALGEDRATVKGEHQRQRGRAIIVDLLNAEHDERVSAGRDTWSLRQQDALAQAVDHALFGLGRLQPLVDDDRVENVLIFGFDEVFLELTDGRMIPGPPVADSDQELIDFLVFLASRSEVNARPFSESQPRLHMRLDGGARLAAAAWVTPRPSVVIRRHRLRQVTLEDLVTRGTLTSLAASFLAAAVRARRSIVVSGAQGAGKTTLVRALCAEIPRHEVIGTFETEYELHLHELRDQHPFVFAWEARPGSGERAPDGRQAGEFTLTQALFDSFRFDLSRQIVGEVRGPEVLAMLKAMESGAGSISTTHAPHGTGAVNKLVTCAMEAGPQITHDYAVRAIAASIDVVVHLHLETTPLPDGTARRDRWVTEILTLAPGERERGYAVQHVFAASAGGRQAQPRILPDDYRDLAFWGFPLEEFYGQAGAAS